MSRKHPEDTRDDAHIRNELVTCAGTGKAIYFFLYSWKKIILVEKKTMQLWLQLFRSCEKITDTDGAGCKGCLCTDPYNREADILWTVSSIEKKK